MNSVPHLPLSAEMTRKINQNPDQWLTKGVKMINRNAEELLNLVNQILDLRKLEVGRLETNMVQGDLLPLIHYIFESFHSMGVGKNLQMIYQPSAEKAIMDYDAEMVKRIVSNLLSNAIKYSKHGGQIVLKTEIVSTPDELNQELPKSLLIRVKDNGIGIPKKQTSLYFRSVFPSR